MNSEETEARSGGCGRNCVGRCCLPGSKLPLYTFKSYEDQSLKNNTVISSKVIKGKHGFIAQLNEGRHLKKRPTEFRVDRVLQPFDQCKFNFTKVGQEEVLFRFEQIKDNKFNFFPSFPNDAGSGSPSIVAINVSPIEYGHVLLLPRVLDCYPQRIDPDSFLLALHFAKEASDPFSESVITVWVLLLPSTISISKHITFQCLFLLKKSAIQGIVTCKGVRVSQLLDYPVRGLVFEQINRMRDLCDAVSTSCIFLQNNNIPFNVLITNYGKKVLLFPQCYAHKQAAGEVSQELLETQVNPAAWEISGHMVLKRREDFENASEDYACRLLGVVSVSEEGLKISNLWY